MRTIRVRKYKRNGRLVRPHKRKARAFLFHGTGLDNQERIRNEGFKAGSWFSDDPVYARLKSRQAGTGGVLGADIPDNLLVRNGRHLRIKEPYKPNSLSEVWI